MKPSVDFNDPEKYMGNFIQVYLGYSGIEWIRKGAGSGGVTSTTLIYLIERNYVDGVLVSRTIVKDGRISAESFIATTIEEVLESRQSIYMDFNYTKSIKKILEFPGKIAMVGLPCHFEILNEMIQKYPQLQEKIVFKIALFCSGVPKYNMIHEVLKNKGIKESEIKKLYFRQDHWRGKTKIVMNDGKQIIFPYLKNYGMYKNMYFDILPRCSLCVNHFGYDADLSVGDAWLREMKKHPIKHNLFFTKSLKAEEIISNMIMEKYIIAEKTDYKKVLKAQNRPLTYKFYTARARKQIGKIFGINLEMDTPYKSKPHHYLFSFFATLNMKLCEYKTTRRLIYKIPRSIMFLYHGFIRFLLSR